MDSELIPFPLKPLYVGASVIHSITNCWPTFKLTQFQLDSIRTIWGDLEEEPASPCQDAEAERADEPIFIKNNSEGA